MAQMYGVVEYSNYRKEQSFEILHITKDLENAKKINLLNANKHVASSKSTSPCLKITEPDEDDNVYLRCLNKVICSYKLVEVEKTKKGFELLGNYSNIFAVVEIENKIDENVEIPFVDPNIICTLNGKGDDEEECNEEED